MTDTEGKPASTALKVLNRTVFLRALPAVFISFGLPIYSKALGASAFQIGGMFSVLIGTAIILRPLIGYALDRFGRRWFYVAAMLISTLALVLFALAESIAGLYLARTVQGIALSIFGMTTSTMVADVAAESERGKAMGTIRQASSQGGIVGVLAGFTLMSIVPEQGWVIAFLGYAVFSALGTWVAWRSMPETSPHEQSRRLPPFSASRPFIILLVIIFITGASEAMLAPIYLIFLQDKFTTDIMVLAWAFFPAGLVTAFLSTRLGALSDRFGRVWMMALGLVGSALLSLALPWLPGLIAVVVVYTLSAVVWSISEPAEAAFVADIIGEERRGTGYGLYDFSGNLGAAAGPLLGGFLYDSLSRAMPFYLNGFILIISAVLVVLLLRKA